MSLIKFNVGKDFSPIPGGRRKGLSAWSGEDLCEKIAGYLMQGNKVEVTLDGTEGYGASFLDGAFGGLARMGRWSADDLKNILSIKAESPAYQSYVDLAYKYIDFTFSDMTSPKT